ncbi:prohead protease/major capsid protein fusion protein [Jiella pelagia]|uniref:Mu-like prophage major head subunit gpT family protein n=1 Tax=Jiella pelagia TaxID=2986949 RepID=A0ABY7BYW2_9HYPH|nr:prohead protease/major capsid protein fusion protein [Jiella pelagia]WAP69046.1 Mu-like prophage major head subunit gpT family protein [Jiella pelagia]
MSNEQIVNAQERVVDMGVHRARALPVPETFNEQDLTVDCTFATTAQVLRFGWDGPFMEELSMSPEHIRMERMNSSRAPVLNNHSTTELEDIIGVVTSARIEADKCTATIKFSSRESVKSIVQDVKDGIISNISVGYKVYRYEQSVGGETEVPVYVATDWEPYEISVVTVPADAGAGVRNEGNEKNRCTVLCARAQENESNDVMDKETKPVENVQAPVPAPVDIDAERSLAVQADRARAFEIRKIGTAAKLEETEIERMVKDGTAVDEARKIAFDKMAAEGEQNAQKRPTVQINERSAEDVRAAMENALEARANSRVEMTDAGRQFRGYSLMDMARDCLQRSGQNVSNLSRMEIAGRAMHTTSDFPEILANVARRTLRTAYEQAPQTFRPFVTETTATDFKPITRVQLGEAPMPQKVKEAGEFTYGTIGEGKETYKLETYGKILAISRQAVINDDLDVFGRLPTAMGRQCVNKESDLVYDLLTGSYTMSDGTAVFHTDHGNLLTGGASALSEDSLSAARQKMREQKGLDGKTFLNLAPTYLVVGPALETKAEKLLANVTPRNSSDVNVFSGKLQLIVEQRITSATAWYMIAANQVDTIEVAYLDGNRGPQFETRNGFERDGVELKVRMDFAAAPIDYRGMLKSAGL